MECTMPKTTNNTAKKYDYKTLKFRSEKWEIIKELANRLSRKRGDDVSLPAAVLEAVKEKLEREKAVDL
jgi:hypothetical protein